jgi:hypothetical protein
MTRFSAKLVTLLVLLLLVGLGYVAITSSELDCSIGECEERWGLR